MPKQVNNQFSFFIKCLLISCIIVAINSTNYDCTQTDPRGKIGCIACNTILGQKLLYNTQTKLYVCSNLVNCLTVSSNGTCTSCQTNYTLIDTQCFLMNITNCIQYYKDSNGILKCKNCTQNFMDPIKDCVVDQKYCSLFDYNLTKCSKCGMDQYLDASGKFCLSPILNCLLVKYYGCQLCEQQYTINPTSNFACEFKPQVEYQLSKGVVLCLQQNWWFDTASSSCVKSTSTLVYCKADNGNGSCVECIAGYFINQGNCQLCLSYFKNCLTCDNLTCEMCQPTYFLFRQANKNTSTCRQCSTYGCKRCRSQNETIICVQCQRGQTLYDNSCYSCSAQSYFNSYTLQCTSCPQNCAQCNGQVCLWCKVGFALDSSVNKTCKNIQTFSNISQPHTFFQILSKKFPEQQKLIYNNSIQLMSSCQQSVGNGFTCLCPNTSTTSLCYSTQNLPTLNLTSVFGSATINGQQFMQYPQTIRLMAQLPTFADQLTLSIQPSTLIPQNKLASLLQVYTQILRKKALVTSTMQSGLQSDNKRLLQTADDTLRQLFKLMASSFTKTLSLTQATIIYGNGYYMKYYPKNVGQTQTNDQFVQLGKRDTSQSAFVFVWFQNLASSKSLLGNVYVFSPLAAYSQSLKVKQLLFPSTSYTLKYYMNNQPLDSQITKSSGNYVTLTLLTSTQITVNAYKVQYQQNAPANIQQLYSSQRIQFIFYQSAFIYVIVFLALYLLLVPCCSLVDFIDRKSGHRRKRVMSQDLTMSQQAKHQYQQRQQDSSQPEINITVNYRDFFPIYNVCNTPRPRRILKLCLFLLNVQHSVTFLTLIYFNLDPGHPVIAVALGVPAYFCTVFMGYICGCLSLFLPGFTKYLINILVVGYWILWILLMPRFKSQQYQPYVYIFAIVFFFIDLLIDTLQMFMVYFTIKQSERQIKMFKCLAAWLSKRGYYEYDKLAKQLSEV